jgi:hypothetical protein
LFPSRLPRRNRFWHCAKSNRGLRATARKHVATILLATVVRTIGSSPHRTEEITIMLRKIALAAFTAATLGAAVSSANAAGCAPWVCGENGRDINGISRNGRDLQGTQLNGLGRNGIERGETRLADRIAVRAVILSSGETIDLR